jgi:hypothetical protein
MNDWLALPLVVICFVLVGVLLMAIILGGYTIFHKIGQKLPRLR